VPLPPEPGIETAGERFIMEAREAKRKEFN
jgi:hypothetical protein